MPRRSMPYASLDLMISEEPPFTFACLRCRASLCADGVDRLRCPQDGLEYRRVDGIWRFLDAEGERRYARFMHEYETIRQAEGRGSAAPAYFRALPYQDLSGRYTQDWGVRAASFDAFSHHIWKPLMRGRGAPLKVLDLGAGNGWLSNHLAGDGHHLAAIDLSTNKMDGLGAFIHYENSFTSLQADFLRLPFIDQHVDLAVFNASLHYATSFEAALRESLRVLKPAGRLVILDTPVYLRTSSGERMVRQRERLFLQRYGFPSNAIPSENFLTFERLDTLGEMLSLRWSFFYPHYNLRWKVTRWITRLRSGHELAKFIVIAGDRC